MNKLHRFRNALFAVIAVAVVSAVSACSSGASNEPLSLAATPPTTAIEDSSGDASSQDQAAVSSTAAQPVTDEPVMNESTVMAKSGGDAIAAAPDSTPAPQLESELGETPAVPVELQVLAAQEALLTSIYDRIVPSVVRIVTSPGTLGASEGSGFVWDDRGHIVTNYHVVRGGGVMRALFFSGDEYDATVVGSDPDADIAVIKIDAPAEKLTPIELGDSSGLRPGQFTIAIGAPFGQDFTMTGGIISAVGRLIDSGFSQFAIPEVIQTDAAINPGNSGGPLLDWRGQMIGINTQIRGDARQNSGVGFAVPVDLAKRVVPSLIEDGEHRYSWLGISAQDVDKDLRDEAGFDNGLRGTLVQDVTPDSPADRAGLRGGDEQITVLGRPVMIGGDIITSIDGEPVLAIEDIIAYLALNTSPGDSVTLSVLRDGENTNVLVELGERPASPTN